MRTQVNPGTLLEVTGSFELQQFGVGVDRFVAGDRERYEVVVIDRESRRSINLAELLRSFLPDPDETITGPIRIRIESALLSPGASFGPSPDLYVFTEDDPAGLWRQGDLAVDLGPEAEGSPVRSIRHVPSGEILGLSAPFKHLRKVV